MANSSFKEDILAPFLPLTHTERAAHAVNADDSEVLSICELALDTLLPVTNYLPPGEPGAEVDQARVIGPWCSKELVRADVTLVPARGEVPVRQRKGLIAHQALQWTEVL